MKRIISAALLVSLLISSLISCGGTDAADNSVTDMADTGSPADTEAVSGEETTLFTPDGLPADLDLGGREVQINIGNYNDAYWTDFYSGEETGNRLSDTIFRTIQSVSDRLNVKLTYSRSDFTWSDMNKYIQQIKSVILAGDDSIDLIMGAMSFCDWRLEGDYLADLSKTAYIDLSKPWYNQTVISNLPDDRIDFIVGDFSLVTAEYPFGMYFNQNLYESLGRTEDLYGIVDGGKWTYEKLTSLIADSYGDLDGDGKAGAGDRYGLVFGDSNKYLGFLQPCGIKMFVKTDGGYEFVYDNEHAVNAIQYLAALINENGNVRPALGNADNPELMSSGGGNYVHYAFLEGRSMFTGALVRDAAAIIPNIDFQYGLLPFPKYEESYEYASMLQRSGYAQIPVTATNADDSSAVLEALSSEYYRTVMPEYCEVTLKTRYSQDSDVSRMFDLIIHSVTFDPGELYAMLLGTPSGMIKEALATSSPNWVSMVAKRKDTMISEMQKVSGAAG
ncbi:MAG: extracellular solute-binding protein [Clostridiales bacterium]|nr:extracellular solute-binding protein [Clostridiales bacterium]